MPEWDRKVPFIGKNMMRSENQAYRWFMMTEEQKEKYGPYRKVDADEIFEADLKVANASKGYSSAFLVLEDREGGKYCLSTHFMPEVCFRMKDGWASGFWGFTKIGQAYSLRPLFTSGWSEKEGKPEPRERNDPEGGYFGE